MNYSKAKIAKIKELEEYSGYLIYSNGVIFSTKSRKFMKRSKTPHGYRVKFTFGTKTKSLSVAELVASSFLPNPNNYVKIKHIDGDVYNDRVGNLEWCHLRDWKPLPDKDQGAILLKYPNYIIYPDGEVYSLLNHKFIQFQKRGGYKYTSLTANGKRISNISQHKLISMTFISNPKNHPIPNHLDGDGFNNSLDNLEWESRSGNAQHAHDTGLIKRRFRPVEQYERDWTFVKRYNSIKEAGEALGKCPKDISRVCRGKRPTAHGYRWKYEKETEKFNTKDGEKWKDCHISPKYKISSHGRIYSMFYQRYMRPALRKDGYMRVQLLRKMYYVHRIVAYAFLGQPPKEMVKPVVDHIDGNKSNNRVENLEWVEHRENIRRSHVTGSNSSGKPCVQYDRYTGKEIERFSHVTKAAEKMNVSSTTILDACHGRVVVSCGYLWRFADNPLDPKDVGKVKSSKTEVVQYSCPDAILIQKYESIKEASKETGIDGSSISQACRKYYKAGGFWWRRLEDDPPEPGEKIAKVNRPVYQQDDNGNIIQEWSSIKKAAQELGIISYKISVVCDGKRKTHGGYRWSYVE
ncbi:MAG: HNH endonuclease [Promethearchaeia archaeon]